MMNYTIIKDLLPTLVKYEDGFDPDKFLVDDQETDIVPSSGGGSVSATIFNRWSWDPKIESYISLSGNRLVITEDCGSWHYDSFFDSTATANNTTFALGVFPTLNLDSFSTSWEAEAKFSQWLFQNGSVFPYKPADHCTFQTGLYVRFKATDVIAKIYLQFNIDPSDTYAFKVMADVFHLNNPVGSGISYAGSPLPEVTLSSHPTDPREVDYINNFTFRLTGKNRVIDFEYSEDGTTWNTLYTFENSSVISSDFAQECEIGLYYSCNHRGMTTFPDYVYTLYEYMKVNSWSYTDVIDKCDDHYFSTTNNNYLDYIETSSDSFSAFRQENSSFSPIGTLPIWFSTLIETPITYTNNEYGVYTEVLLNNFLSGAGIVVYDDKTPQDFIVITVNKSKLLTVYRLSGTSSPYLVYSEHISGLDTDDWVELGAGFDSFDNTIVFWADSVSGDSYVEAVVRIEDFRTSPTTTLALLTNTDITMRNSSVIKVESRVKRDLEEGDYSIECENDDISIEQLTFSIDSVFADYEAEVTNVTNLLNNSGVVSSFNALADSLEEVKDAAGIVEEQLTPDITFEEALSTAGISVIGGIPLVEGEYDLSGYSKLYEFFEDLDYIDDLLTSSTNFVFIITKNEYAQEDKLVSHCSSNKYSEEDYSEYPANNIFCDVSGDITVPVNTSEKIGEIVIGINKRKSEITDDVMKLEVVAREQELNYYIFWLEKIDASFFNINKLKFLGLSDIQLLVIDDLGYNAEENLNVYLLPAKGFDDIEDLWGDITVGDLVDILEDPPEFSISAPTTVADVTAVLENFRVQYPQFNSDLNYDPPEYEDFEIEEEEPEPACSQLLDFLEKLKTKLQDIYDLTSTTIEEPLNSFSSIWGSVLALLDLGGEVTKFNANLVGGASAISALISSMMDQINVAVNLFTKTMQGISDLFSKGLKVVDCIKGVIELFDIDVEDALNFTSQDLLELDALNSATARIINTCTEDVAQAIIGIIGIIQNFVLLFSLLINKITNVFTSLKQFMTDFDLVKAVADFAPSCSEAVSVVEALLDKLQGNDESITLDLDLQEAKVNNANVNPVPFITITKDAPE